MAITFVSKTSKKRSLLLDALRILAWEEYRATNKESLKNLEYGGYEIFEAEWKVHDIQHYTYPELVTFAKSLEFAENELLLLRSNYYDKKGNFSRSNSKSYTGSYATKSASETTELASAVDDPNVDDSVQSEESQALPNYDEAPF